MNYKWQNKLIQMSKQSAPSEFTIRCECTFEKNSIRLNLNTKSKYFNITLASAKLLVYSTDTKAKLLEYEITKIRQIRNKFITEGKLTIEICEGYTIMQTSQTDLRLSQPIKNLSLTHIFIHNSSQQNLELFIKKLKTAIDIVKINKPVKKVFEENNKIEVLKKQKVSNQTKLDRKSMRQAAYQQQRQVQKIDLVKKVIPIIKKPNKIKKPSSQFQSLPAEIFRVIIGYAGLHLGHRLVSKFFSSEILQNIISIKLHDNIDQQSFKTLTKYARKVECRMKFVSDISHFVDKSKAEDVREEDGKWYKFWRWSQMTAKNVNQLKGLKIYCLELPYNIKFSSSVLIGITPIYLKLKSKNRLQSRNTNISDSDIIQLINTSVRKIEIEYVESSFFEQIVHPEKIQIIKIGVLQIRKQTKWNDFTKFINLQTLAIRTVKNEFNQQIEFDIQTPQSLRKLKIGDFMTLASLNRVNKFLQYLKICSQHVNNNDISNLIFPVLKILDVVECPCVNYEALEYCANIQIRVKWEQYMLQHTRDYFLIRNIKVVNFK